MSISSYRTRFLSLYRQLLRQCEQLPRNNMHKRMQHMNTIKQKFRSETASYMHHAAKEDSNDTHVQVAQELLSRAQQHLSYLRMISPRNSRTAFYERDPQTLRVAMGDHDQAQAQGQSQENVVHGMGMDGKRVFQVDQKTGQFVEVFHGDQAVHGRNSTVVKLRESDPFQSFAYIGDPLPEDNDGWELTRGDIIVDDDL